MESTESRFAHLLQPIRELTKNWEIDVASELNDYLEELDEMCITFDGGKTRLNFAEAALLIQGSTCIYSKKVELLHSLVYQTLDYINDKNKKRNKEAVASENDGADRAVSNHSADDMAEFTPLDLEASEVPETSDSRKPVAVTPLPPDSLILPEARKKQNLPLISVKGEVLCSLKDFRINLFLPGDNDLIQLSCRSLMDHRPADSGIHQQHGDGGGGGDAGGGDAAESFLPVEDDNMELDPEEHVDRHQAPSDGRMIRERRQVEADGRRRGVEGRPAVNVWSFHDAYATVGEDKPFKSGKCYKAPDGLDDKGKRKRKRAASLQDFRSWFTGTFDPPERKFKSGPTFTDLNYVYLSALRDKVRTQQRINRKAGVLVSDDELRRTFLQPTEEGPQRQGEEPEDELRHADLLGGDDDHSDYEHGAFPDGVPAELDGGADFLLPGAQRDGLSYEDLVKLRVEQLVANSRGYTQETALSRRVKDWEDAIRAELLLQEERPAFDIHDYGDRIIGSLSGIGHHRSFSSIVHGLDNFEACKYLLASLQLANDYTVEVDSAAGLEDSLDTMGLTLLSTVRATDRFRSLQAHTDDP